VEGCWTCGCWTLSGRISLCLTAWMSVSCGCCLFSGTGLCVSPIHLPEKSYWLSCVLLSMISQSPQQGRLRPSGAVALYEKKILYMFSTFCYFEMSLRNFSSILLCMKSYISQSHSGSLTKWWCHLLNMNTYWICIMLTLGDGLFKTLEKCISKYLLCPLPSMYWTTMTGNSAH
jgi:hypothetical protein